MQAFFSLVFILTSLEANTTGILPLWSRLWVLYLHTVGEFHMSTHSVSHCVYSCHADNVIRELLSEVTAGSQWDQETEYGVWSLQEVHANVLVRPFFFLLRHSNLHLFLCSMEMLDRKFEQVLALQQLDKSKAISQILQEVKMCFTRTRFPFCKNYSVLYLVSLWMWICFILQEEMQKAAFEALQLQRDSVHGYIRNQVDIIV